MTKICKGLDGCWLSLLWLWTCLEDQERPRSAGILQRCHETSHFGHEFWVFPVTSSVPTDFLPASLGKQAKQQFEAGSPLRRSGGICHDWNTGCHWMKPLQWFYSALPDLAGIMADPQEVGRKPTTSSFFWASMRNAALPPSLPMVFLLLPMGRLCASLLLFLHLKEHALKLDFSNIWMPMPFNLWMLQYILLCWFKSGRAQVLYSHV